MGVCRRLNRNVNSFRYALHVLLLDASMVGAEEPRLEIRKGDVDMWQDVHRSLFFSLDLRGVLVAGRAKATVTLPRIGHDL